MRQLFDHLSQQLSWEITISSDECPFYKSIVKKYFPTANYTQYLRKNGCVACQGELKKTAFDPIFSINHTFAMMIANISRLIRKTWNSTKKIEGLIDHLNILNCPINLWYRILLYRKPKSPVNLTRNTSQDCL